MRRLTARFAAAFLAFWLLAPAADARTPPPISGRGAESGQALLPSDVLARVRLVQEEVEEIRAVMGRPVSGPPHIHVENAQPREVYFQALSLYRKVDRLGFELLGQRGHEPALPAGSIHPEHVWAVVDASLERLQGVQGALGITLYAAERPADEDATPSDVFNALVLLNQQLNLLLDKEVSTRDVFQEVTWAVHYAARLLEPSGGPRIPPEPTLESDRQPRDIYLRLEASFATLQRIYHRSGLTILEIQESGKVREIEAGNVYDIAQLLVSELSYLHEQIPDAAPVNPAYPPGRKFPSHVHQRAGVLERQLDLLDAWTQSNPDWLAP